ncbi:sigma-70 family RNA polymerase sigma factor [Paenibacillus mucilaginosus]|uniref:RNA polymerase ECF-type sigma factor n=1 Tax=Paenibacillus mucilaginosus (strain KNP414) TaxID=1036673 RepID=F8FC69_PAEMK|nr:sigma-70 family RNA polymerase sigma factor [Paenibacillus mucilaginosus]AEI44470.1 RNA polymerase ECF-type sigma factor [Paenibacillus mucilaginosus KNP414]MCG7217530.1 sigma-70 family RNA polymerase sigma factor [Paenibacillus mucilaginosus]WDM30927.1 sigma-70 family RNA polymerase sigma factor [Paenibacillus mucilaginosus]
MSVHETVLAAIDGDEEAFFSLVSGRRERLYRIAFAYVRNEANALEAIQEVTCRAYLQLSKLREPRYFDTWLTRILIYYCIDEQRRRRRVCPAASIPEEIVTDGAGLGEQIRMEQAVGELQPNLRHVIMLKYDQDMTLAEIARLLKRPEGTVKTWLHKALKQLRRSIGRDE